MLANNESSSSSSSPSDSLQPLNNCIGNLEHHVHKVFATIRVPGEDFVYSASLDLFNRLDEYCDDSDMDSDSPRMPFLIKGESGTGKSALLSNWLDRRERMLGKTRNNHEEKEFTFWHAVGCSRQSMNVNVLIRRLIVELKNRFELQRAIPKTQDQYSWELPRFLDLASKKGKTLVVIDGLNRLVNNEGVEDNLAWLPLEFPSNIRVILSVTTSPLVGMKSLVQAVKLMRKISMKSLAENIDDVTVAINHGISILGGDTDEDRQVLSGTITGAGIDAIADKGNKPAVAEGGDGQMIVKGDKSRERKSRILMELDRRKIPYLVMKPLKKPLCRSLVEAFIHKSVNTDTATRISSTGPYISSSIVQEQAAAAVGIIGTATTSVHGKNSNNDFTASNSRFPGLKGTSGQEVPGFLLFEEQISALLSHSQGGTPLFLRLFLRCLQYAASRGYSLWLMFDSWMTAQSVPALLSLILETMEHDFHATPVICKSAITKTVKAGGLPSLRKLYPWHPTFHYSSKGTSGASASAAAVLQESFNSAKNEVLKNLQAGNIKGKQLLQLSMSSIPGQKAGGQVTGHDLEDQLALATVVATSLGDKASDKKLTSNAKLSAEVARNLGDQVWIHAQRDADLKLLSAINDTRQNIENTLVMVKQEADLGNATLLQGLVLRIRNAHDLSTSHSLTGDMDSINESLPSSEVGSEENSSTVRKENYVRSQSRVRSESYHKYLAEDSLGDENMDEADDDEMKGDDDDDITLSDNESLVSIEDRSATSERSIHAKMIKLTQDLIPPSMRSYEYTSVDADGSGAHHHEDIAYHPPPLDSPASSKISDPSSSSSAMHSERQQMESIVDPRDGLDLLPVYLKGGVNTIGFGDLLGNALALLYVARQGLREAELWRMLSLLQYKAEHDNKASKEVLAMNHAVVRKVATEMLRSKGKLMELLRAEDITKTGYIARQRILRCVQKTYPACQQADFLKLVEFVEMNAPPSPEIHASPAGHSNLIHYFQDRDLLIGPMIHYQKLFLLIEKLNKTLKFNEIQKGVKGPTAYLLEAPHHHHHHHQLVDPKQGDRVIIKGAGSAAVVGGIQQHPNEMEDLDYNNFVLIGTPKHNHHQLAVIRESHNDSIDAKPLSHPNEEEEEEDDDDGLPLLHDEVILDSNDEEDEMNRYALGPVVEESLISILNTLGVLHDQENKVLILPSDSEPFRQVILQNYILQRGGCSKEYWHGLVIQHFQTEPNTLRKLEELPWHLQICKKWYALRDVLVDLGAFHLMSTASTNELMGYWILLTEGPLPTPEKDLKQQQQSRDGSSSKQGTPSTGATTAAIARSHSSSNIIVPKGSNQSGVGPESMDLSDTLPGSSGNRRKNKDDSRGDVQDAYDAILAEIDYSMKHNISLKDLKKRANRHQIPPFDIVDEMNKSLELWVQTDHPSAQKIHQTILSIARFLYDFSRKSTSTPDFLRLGISMEALNLFGGQLDAELKGISGQSNLDKGVGSALHEGTGGDIDGENGFLNQNGAASPGNRGANRLGGGEAGDVKDVPQFPPRHFLQSRMYVYLRWIWIQFPWLALHSARSVGMHVRKLRYENKHKYDSSRKDDSQGNSSGGGESNLITRGTLNLTSTNHPIDASNEEVKGGDEQLIDKDSMRMLRVWDVKKCDPTVPLFQYSMSRRLAAIQPRSSLSKSLERNVEVTYDKLYAEFTAPSHISKVRVGHQVIDKYRRPFKDELELNRKNDIPFAYHGVRSMKAGTLFPSYEKMLAEKNAIALKESEEYRGKKKLPLVPFNVDVAITEYATGKVGPDSSLPMLLIEVDDAIRGVNNDEYIDRHKSHRTSGGIIRDEVDLELEACVARISAMKNICNKLTIIQKEKKRIINGLKKEILRRQEADERMISDVCQSEELLRTLHERNKVVETETEEASLVEEGLIELITVLRNNPPYIESHVQALECEVELAERQFEEMCLHRHRLYHPDELLDGEVAKAKALEKIAYLQNARSEVARKKKEVLKELRTLRVTFKNIDRYSKRQTVMMGGAVKMSDIPIDGTSPLASDDDDNGSDDSGSTSEQQKELNISKPVKLFLNALLRKTNFNEETVLSIDGKLSDVKKRFDSKQPPKNPLNGRRLNRLDSYKEVMTDKEGVTGDAGSAGSGSVQSLTSIGSAVRQKYGAGLMEGFAITALQLNKLNLQASIIDASGPRVSMLGGRRSGISFGGVRNGNNNVDYASSGGGGGASSSSSLAGPRKVSNAHNSSNNNNNNNNMLLSKNELAMIHQQSSNLMTTGASFKKLTSEEINQLKTGIQNIIITDDRYDQEPSSNNNNNLLRSYSANGDGHNESLRLQVHKVLNFLLQKTESSSVTEFIERYTKSIKLLETLVSQQSLVDSRLSQLQAEHTELFQEFSDLEFNAAEKQNSAMNAAAATTMSMNTNSSVVAGGGGGGDTTANANSNANANIASNSNTTSSSSNSNSSVNTITDRYLDNQLFAKEVRKNYFLRAKERAELQVSNVRSAIGSLIYLLTINNKLLHALPKSTPPPLVSDSDMLRSLSWFEDRIIALNEALAMDTNKGTTDDNKTLNERQLDLALSVQRMQKEELTLSSRPSSRQKLQNSMRKRNGLSATVLLGGDDEGDPLYVSNAALVKVPPTGRVDKLFDSRMSKLQQEKDRQSDAMEYRSSFAQQTDGQYSEVHDFLMEGLDHKVTKDLSRKANLLRNRPSSGSIGIVLENLMSAKGQKFSLNTKKNKQRDATETRKKSADRKSREKDRVSTAGSAMSGSGGRHKSSSVSVKGNSLSTQGTEDD